MSTTKLNCDACGEPAIGVASSCIPMSFAYCRRCVSEGVEPEFIFAYHYDEVSRDGEGLADWFTQSVKIFKDGEIWTWDKYVQWRHATGRGKSEPCEPPPPPEDYDYDILPDSLGDWKDV